jgi:hypothetical protein
MLVADGLGMCPQSALQNLGLLHVPSNSPGGFQAGPSSIRAEVPSLLCRAARVSCLPEGTPCESRWRP